VPETQERRLTMCKS